MNRIFKKAIPALFVALGFGAVVLGTDLANGRPVQRVPMYVVVPDPHHPVGNGTMSGLECQMIAHNQRAWPYARVVGTFGYPFGQVPSDNSSVAAGELNYNHCDIMYGNPGGYGSGPATAITSISETF